MKNVEMLTIAHISQEKPHFISPELNSYTDKLIAIYSNASKYADQKNREIAGILGEIADKKAYEADGFKSVADYAATIFGIKKDHAYALSRAGKIYNDPQASPVLKAMSPSKLNELDAVKPEKVAEAIEKGFINADTTQSDLRNFAKEMKEPGDAKPTVVKLYEAFPCLPIIPEAISTKLAEARIPDDWDQVFVDYVRSVGNGIEPEVLALPKAKVNSEGKKATIIRKLYISRSYSIAVMFKESKPAKPSKKSNTAKPKFTRDELMAMLAEMDKDDQ